MAFTKQNVQENRTMAKRADELLAQSDYDPSMEYTDYCNQVFKTMLVQMTDEFEGISKSRIRRQVGKAIMRSRYARERNK